VIKLNAFGYPFA